MTVWTSQRRVVAAVVVGALCLAGVAWIGVSGRLYGSDPQIESLLGKPDAALAFLYPDGAVEPGTSSVAIEYIRDRNWNDDGFDTLAQMLDQAATAYRDPDDPRSELSALAATDTIDLLGERGDDRISERAYDSLSHLLTVYIADVDADAQAREYPLWKDLAPRAMFTRSKLRIVLRQVLTDNDALDEITIAAIQLNGFRMADEIDPVDPNPNLIWAQAHDAMTLLSYIGYVAGFRQATEPDARADAMLAELGNAVNLRPRPGARFTQFEQGEDIRLNTAETSPVDYLADGSTDRRSDIFDAIAKSTSYLTGVQLGEAGLLKGSNADGEPYPWFADDTFNAATALLPEHRDAFALSLKQDPDWGLAVFADIRIDVYYGPLHDW